MQQGKVITNEQKTLIDSLIAVENDNTCWDEIYSESNGIISMKREKENCIFPVRLHAVIPDISFQLLTEMIIVPEVRRKWDKLQGFDIIE